MKRFLAILAALALLASPIGAQHSGPLNSNVASVRLTFVVPESATMSATINDDNTATARISYNLVHAPQRVGVLYQGVEYDALCRNEPRGQLAAMGSVDIVVPLQPGEMQRFQLVIS